MTALLLAALLAQSREVLCLYDSNEGRTELTCEAQVYAEPALNHIGLFGVYRDVNEPLLTDEEMARFRGVLTWFTDSRMKNATAYWAWLGRQPAQGRKVVIIGNLGATDGAAVDTINNGLAPLGLTYRGSECDNASAIEVLKKDPMVEFERPLDRDLRWYLHMKADESNSVYLRIRRTDLPNSESDVVVTGPRGGFAWVALHYDAGVDRDQWRLDPFAFLSRAFGIDGDPRLDLTTAMGRRIFFATIDGDGVGNRAQPGPKVGRLCGEIVRDDYLKKIDLPVTASVIAADLEDHEELAKSIFELPNVEVAAHGYYHPLSWTHGTLSYPASFNLKLEVVGAVKRLAALQPKPVRTYLWTGSCDPPPEALAMCDGMGIANMNGANSGQHKNYESLTNMRCVAQRRGGRLHFNARAMSENHFTALWTRNYHNFRAVIASYELMEKPYRVAPIHLYFHYYLVEQPGGDRALQEIFDWIQAREIYPMTASEYVAWVRGFYAAKVEKAARGTWRVRDYGACRTVRFDDTERFVDIGRSTNVLGFRRDGNTLYVHLAEGTEAVIALSRSLPGEPYLIEANGDWRDGRIVARTAARATFSTRKGPVAVGRGSAHEVEADIR